MECRRSVVDKPVGTVHVQLWWIGKSSLVWQLQSACQTRQQQKQENGSHDHRCTTAQSWMSFRIPTPACRRCQRVSSTILAGNRKLSTAFVRQSKWQPFSSAIARLVAQFERCIKDRPSAAIDYKKVAKQVSKANLPEQESLGFCLNHDCSCWKSPTT